MTTVLLATRNGAATLPRTLSAFEHLRSPESGWKLVVVDNGSSDGTADILSRFEARLPLTRIRQTEPGKNAALNAGLSHVESGLTVLTDDDVLPREDWLVQFEAAARAHPSYAMFGGAIVAHWDAPPPDWLRALDHGYLFTVTDPRLQDGPTRPETLFGPNMAIRSDIFEGGIRFDPSIGPCGSTYAMGSETDLVQRLSGLGYRAWHVSSAIVEHIVRPHQLDMRWAAGRAFRFGRGMYRIQRMAESEPHYPWAARMLLKMARRSGRAARAYLVGDDAALASARWDFNYFLGLLVEARRSRRLRSASLVQRKALHEESA